VYIPPVPDPETAIVFFPDLGPTFETNAIILLLYVDVTPVMRRLTLGSIVYVRPEI
jgi:hypothetical protein